MFSISLYSSKNLREEKMKGDVVHIFKNNKTFVKYEVQLLMAITSDSSIKTTIIIYQIDAHINLHNMIR